MRGSVARVFERLNIDNFTQMGAGLGAAEGEGSCLQPAPLLCVPVPGGLLSCQSLCACWAALTHSKASSLPAQTSRASF